MSADYVKVGEITAASGLRGDLRVRSFTRPDLEIFDFKSWVLGPENRPGVAQRSGEVAAGAVTLRSGRRQGKHLIADLQGVDDRDAAEALVGMTINVRADAMPEPDPGQYYWDQLIGLRVRNLDGEDLGIVDHLLETGANDVLVVRTGSGSEQKSGSNSNETAAEDEGGEERVERLLPWIDSVVIEVELEQGQMTVDWDKEF